MAVQLVLRILVIQLSVRSGATGPDSWIEAGSGDSKMCAGVTAKCEDAPTCTYHAYGPCGGAAEPSVYFEAQILGMALIFDSEAYLADEVLLQTGGPTATGELVRPSGIENNGYNTASSSEMAGDAEYAFLAAGAWYGDPMDTGGGFLGMASYLLKKGTITTKSNNVLVPEKPGSATVDPAGVQVCIADLEGGECGAERTFNEGEYKFSVYGYTYGPNYNMDSKVTHIGIRSKLALVGAEAEVRINDDLQTLDEIGSTDVKKIVVSEVAEGGRSVTIDFPQKYNTGVVPDGLMKPTATKNVKIKVSEVEGEQAIYIDYLFERFDNAMEYFIYDPTVTEGTGGTSLFDQSYGSREVFSLLLLIVPGLFD